MKKIVLFSALILMAAVSVAQAPKPVSKLVTIAGQHGGGQGSSSSGGQGGGPQGGYREMWTRHRPQWRRPRRLPPQQWPKYGTTCDVPRRLSHGHGGSWSSNFDSDNLRVSNQVLRGHFMSSIQVRDMARLFTFESYRVRFVKAAYLKVVDQQNFYVVNEVFTFSSSIAEVVNYTNSVGFAGGGTWTSGHGGSNGGGHRRPCRTFPAAPWWQRWRIWPKWILRWWPSWRRCCLRKRKRHDLFRRK